MSNRLRDKETIENLLTAASFLEIASKYVGAHRKYINVLTNNLCNEEAIEGALRTAKGVESFLLVIPSLDFIVALNAKPIIYVSQSDMRRYKYSGTPIRVLDIGKLELDVSVVNKKSVLYMSFYERDDVKKEYSFRLAMQRYASLSLQLERVSVFRFHSSGLYELRLSSAEFLTTSYKPHVADAELNNKIADTMAALAKAYDRQGKTFGLGNVTVAAACDSSYTYTAEEACEELCLLEGTMGEFSDGSS